jgi:hypothetical protein
MKIQKVFKSLIIQATVLAMLLIGLCAIPSSSYMIDSLPKIDNISLPGAHGATNNTVFVFDRYSIVAPFGPSGDIGDGDDLSKFDNNLIYLFDTKKPESSPKTGKLNNCYFPTKVAFDAGSGTVFVRGTEYVEVGAGQYEAREVLVHIRLNLEADGKPAFDPDGAVPIRIPGRFKDYTEDAPSDFAIGQGGKILVFTNGYAIFTYDIVSGDVYPVGIDNKADNVITYLDIDEASNTLMVGTSARIELLEGVVKFTSDLYFYKLERDGSVNLIRHLSPDSFGDGIYLSAGSNAAISWDPNLGIVEFGYFTTSDGAVCQIDLRSKDDRVAIERLTLLPEFAQQLAVEPGPVFTKFDRSKKLLTIVKQGGFGKIRRPTFVERAGRIRRPTFTQFEGSAVIGLVQLSKKNRVVGQRIFDKPFGKEFRISNLVAGQGSIGLISTYSGLVFTLDSSVSLDRASVNFIGELGPRIDYIAYNASRQSLMAISSYSLNDENQTMLPGSIMFARIPLSTD